MHNTIVNAVATAIAAMGSPPANIIVRKETVRLDGDAMPLCIVSQEGDRRDVSHLFGGGHLREYDVRITYLRSGKMQLQTNVADNPNMAEAIREALEGTTLTGVSAVWDVSFPPAAAIKAGSVASGYDQSTFVVTYHTSEASP